MIGSNLEKHFDKIGAKHKIVKRAVRNRDIPPAISLNIINRKGEELFEITMREDIADSIDISVLEVKPEERHLVLMARGGGIKEHFLCGHDERHLFVASVQGVSTVAAAKASLKPESIREQETGLTSQKRNRRKTKIFVRQGEWFFIPSDFAPSDPKMINKNEALRRSGSKSHVADFGYRTGGESVMVCSRHPNGVTQEEYRQLVDQNPSAKNFNWRNMVRNAQVYVKGAIRHPDHATIVLDRWHLVLMNTERRSQAVAFLD